MNELYGLGKSVRELAFAVKRGGTSGIGVTAFEKGGFIVDGGHRFKDKGAFMPSAASRVPPGPVLFREDFPDWDIVIAVPNEKGMHDQEEIDVFKKFCPLPIEEVREVAIMAGASFLVNVTLNSGKEMTGVFAGTTSSLKKK